MTPDVDWKRVNELVDPAETAMETLNEDGHTGREPERRDYGVYLSWTGADGIGRNVEASVHPGTYELEVVYNAWSEHRILGHDDNVRLWTRHEIGRFGDPTDAIDDAIQKAYDEAEAVTGDDLNRTNRVPRYDH